MEFGVLGPIQVRTSDGQTVGFDRKSSLMVAMLVFAAPNWLAKEQLVEVAWDGKGSSNNVEAAIGRLRRKLKLLPNDPALNTEGPGYRLAASTDTQRFKDLSQRAVAVEESGDRRGAVIAYDEALRVWRGDLSRDLVHAYFQPIVASLQTNLRRIRLARLRLLEAEERWDQLLVDVDDVLKADPLHDDACMMKANATYHCLGLPAAAEYLRAVFATRREELGLDPSHEMSQLYESLLNEPPRSTSKPNPVLGQGPMTRLDESQPASNAVPNRVRHNLPPRTYYRFTDRPDEWKQLENAMASGLPIVGLVGIGGNGKSTLAREFAGRLAASLIEFSEIIWISDRELPGSTTLTHILDGIAQVMEHPGISSLPTVDKKREVIALLRGVSALLVIDNFETVSNSEIIPWLLTLPDSTKVILTSISHIPDLEDYSYDVVVRGLSKSEVESFYDQLIDRLNLQEFRPEAQAMTDLWETSGGNPALIMWALGQVARRGRPLSDVIADISNTRRRQIGGVADDRVIRDLLRGSWQGLSAQAQAVLASLACFPYGAERSVIREVAGDPVGFDAQLGELHDLCFTRRLARDREHDSEAWFAAEHLAATRADLLNGPEFERIRDRWLTFCINLSESVGFCPDNLERLAKLDSPGIRENLQHAVQWALANGRFREAIKISRGLRYYYYVRGLWSTVPDINLMRAQAAQQLGDAVEEFDALVYYVNIAAKQENLTAVEQQLTRLADLRDAHENLLPPKSLAEYRHALALSQLAAERYDEAEQTWRANIEESEADLGPDTFNANLRWLAICLARSGKARALDARQMFQRARIHAGERYPRARLLIELQQCELDLDEVADPASGQALYLMLTGSFLANLVNQVADRRYTADYYWLLARALKLSGDTSAARIKAGNAADLYVRLGLSSRAVQAAALAGEV